MPACKHRFVVYSSHLGLREKSISKSERVRERVLSTVSLCQGMFFSVLSSVAIVCSVVSPKAGWGMGA